MQLSSKKQRILIFSDPHQDIRRVEHILKHEDWDKVVCLGDWFDSRDYNTEADLEKTCEFLKKWLNKPEFVTLFGNHDTSYLYFNNKLICGGYKLWKDDFITDFFGEDLLQFKKKFLWYLWVDDFLCTHAGLHIAHLPPRFELNKPNLTKWLDQEIDKAEIYLNSGESYWLYMAGAARGGPQLLGGINWLDFNHEFEPITEIKQIVGHTNGERIRGHHLDGEVDLKKAPNLDIDCHLSEYLIIENGEIKIKKYSDI
jgi:hypothetical protein